MFADWICTQDDKEYPFIVLGTGMSPSRSSSRVGGHILLVAVIEKTPDQTKFKHVQVIQCKDSVNSLAQFGSW